MKRELNAVVLDRKVCFAQSVVLILLLPVVCSEDLWNEGFGL